MLDCEPIFTNHPNKFSGKDNFFAGKMNLRSCQKLCIDKRVCKATSWIKSDKQCYLYEEMDENASHNFDAKYQTIYRPCSE